MSDAAYDASRHRKAGRGKVYPSIIDTIGDTPLVALPRLIGRAEAQGDSAGQAGVLQPDGFGQGPYRRGHDRGLEQAGKLTPDTVLIEPTSGNTGIALAFVAAAKGYPAEAGDAGIHVDRAAQDAGPSGRRTGADPGREGHEGRDRHGRGTAGATPGAGHPGSSTTSPIRKSTAVTTAEEIWNDTGGGVDVVIAGVGTGGTITGVGQVLKARKPSVRMIAVEPEDSPVLSGRPARPAQDPGHRRRVSSRPFWIAR
jgi:cysteine synthase A